MNSDSRSHSSGKTSVGHLARDDVADEVLDEADRLLAQVLTLEDLPALAVDGLALAVHDLVVLQHVLAPLVVELFDLLLRVLDGLRDHLRLDRLVVGPLQALHDRGDAVAREHAHQIVLEREVEPGQAGVALAARIDRAAGCRCAATRAARCRARTARRARPPRRARRRSAPSTSRRSARTPPRRRRAPRRPCRTAGSGRCPSRARPSPGARGTPGCRRAGCRRRGRPCWSPR